MLRAVAAAAAAGLGEARLLTAFVPLTPRLRRMIEALPGAVVAAAALPLIVREGGAVEHDPEKWEPVFGEDHAQTKS